MATDVWADSEEGRALLAEAFSQPNARSRGGKRADLGGRYFRSSWEANYARYLNWLQSIGQIDRWDYENEEFGFPVKRGSRFYVVDFRVWVSGQVEYHEVKGYMDQKSKTKLARMAKYYPQVVIKVIDREAYQAIARQVSAFIENWE